METENSLENSGNNDENPSAIETKNIIDPQIEESVNKVENWLNYSKSPETKGSIICLGSITFKRKASSIKSPNSDIENNNKAPKASCHSTNYITSKYADDLFKKFVEKSQAREDQNGDIWSTLQKKLKARDEEIRNKLKKKLTILTQYEMGK